MELLQFYEVHVKRWLPVNGSWGEVCSREWMGTLYEVGMQNLLRRLTYSVLSWHVGLLRDVRTTPDCGKLCGRQGLELGEVGWQPSASLGSWCWAITVLVLLLRVITPSILEDFPTVTWPVVQQLVLFGSTALIGRPVHTDPGLFTSADTLNWS